MSSNVCEQRLLSVRATPTVDHPSDTTILPRRIGALLRRRIELTNGTAIAIVGVLSLQGCSHAMYSSTTRNAETPKLEEHQMAKDVGNADAGLMQRSEPSSRSPEPADNAPDTRPQAWPIADYLTRLLAGIEVSSASSDADALPPVLLRYSREQILQALSLDSTLRLQIRAARPSGSSSIFVATYRQLDSATDLGSLDARVFLLQDEASRLSCTAQGHLVFSPTQCVEENATPGYSRRDIEIDEHRYSVSVGGSDFAVRLTCSTSEPSRDGEEAHVFLFEADGEKLSQVFTFVSSRSELDRAGGIISTETTMLASQAVTRGEHFDLSLSTHLKRETAPLDDSPVRVLEDRIEMKVFEWSGLAYVLGRPSRRQ
jgi:hypothetical protein